MQGFFPLSARLCLAVSLLAGGTIAVPAALAADCTVTKEINVVTADEPARIRLTAPEKTGTGFRLLEVTLKPLKTAAGETYVVSARAGTNDDLEIVDTFAFFPPPETGVERSFLLDLTGVDGDGPLELELDMIPADPKETLATSSVEVTGVRWVGSPAD